MTRIGALGGFMGLRFPLSVRKFGTPRLSSPAFGVGDEERTELGLDGWDDDPHGSLADMTPRRVPFPTPEVPSSGARIRCVGLDVERETPEIG